MTVRIHMPSASELRWACNKKWKLAWIFRAGWLACDNSRHPPSRMYCSEHDADSFLADENLCKGWWPILARLLVAVETLFLMRTPYYTLGRLEFGLRMTGVMLTFSASCVFLCGFMPLCFELTTGFSHWCAPGFYTIHHGWEHQKLWSGLRRL